MYVLNCDTIRSVELEVSKLWCEYVWQYLSMDNFCFQFHANFKSDHFGF